MLKKLFQSFRLPLRRIPHPRRTPEILSSRQHSLHRNEISRHAVSVVERLQQAGYEAYVVGGCVRDLLLQLNPKDYDVATSATPEQVRAEFRNARVIGRRFKLVHVHFGREIIEVATFRANHPEEDDEDASQLASRNESGRILRDNVYGTLEDDAQRRDFTINALYYDPTSERILDHTRGVHDIRNRLIRLIGDPEQRYQEDPVRMLRAVRFAAKLDFEIERHSAEPIADLAELLDGIPSARLFDETLKLFLGGKAERTFELLLEYDLFAPLFPASAAALERNPEYAGTLIRNALANTDLRIQQGKAGDARVPFRRPALACPAGPRTGAAGPRHAADSGDAGSRPRHHLGAVPAHRDSQALHHPHARDLGHAGTPAAPAGPPCRPASGESALPRWLRLSPAARKRGREDRRPWRLVDRLSGSQRQRAAQHDPRPQRQG